MTAPPLEAADQDSSPAHGAYRMRHGFALVGRLVRPHLPAFITALAGSALFAAGITFGAKALGWVTDNVVVAAFDDDPTTGSSGPLVGAAFLLGVAVMRTVGVVTRRYFAGMVSEQVERRVRMGLARQYVAQPMSWLRRRRTGDLIAHVDTDMMHLVSPLHPLPYSVAVLFLAIFTTVSLFLIDPVLALVTLAIFPLVIAANGVYSRFVEEPIQAMLAANGKVTDVAAESFEGALIVKTLGRQRQEVDRFAAHVHDLRDHTTRVDKMRVIIDAIVGSVPGLGPIVAVVVGALRVEAGAVTAGDIVEVATLVTALTVPMFVLGFFLEELPPAVSAWRRISSVTDYPVPTEPDRSPRPVSGPADLVVENLSFSWPAAPDTVVLDDIELSVRPGEMVAIVGPTGSGKSTLCRAIGGLLDEVDGSITIDGRPIAELHPSDRIDALTVVFQEAFLFADTIAANITFDDHDDEAMTAAADAAAIHDWIESLDAGYETKLGERGMTVSGGQRQRIALARALARRPGLLILDDATSAVDTVIEGQILDRLRDAGDATLVVVANRMATITKADRVVFMTDGRVAAVGTHDDLLERDDYRELVTAYQEAADGR